jgi:hypothetical protein
MGQGYVEVDFLIGKNHKVVLLVITVEGILQTSSYMLKKKYFCFLQSNHFDKTKGLIISSIPSFSQP